MSYLLAFVGALLWSLYCVITRKYSQGHNPIALFFLVITIVLWAKMLLLHGIPEFPSIEPDILIYMLLLSVVTALGYAAWNIGIIQGNIAILVALSYFSPIFSTLISMTILQTSLPVEFWHGVLLVTGGSLICWVSTNWQQIKERIFPVA